MNNLKTIAPMTVTKVRNKYAAYCRVSSDSSDQLNSYAAQIDYYTAYAAEHEDIEFVGIYADEGISGIEAGKRDEFMRMLQDCRDKKIDRILTKSISRFARNTVDCLNALRELKTLGVTVFFEKEALDTANEDTEIMLTAMGCFAQEESLSISKNLRVGVRMRMKNGTFLMSQPPYGYRIENRELVIVPEEADVVKMIFAYYLSGMGKNHIANRLNADNIPRNSNGDLWHMTTINYILKNEKYIGDESLQKTYMTENLPFRKKYNKGQYDKYYYTDCHEPIINRDTFNAVQNLLKQKAEVHYCTVSKNQSIYTSIIRCEECGSTFIAKKTNGRCYWDCLRHNTNSKSCSVGRIAEDEITAAFIRMYNKLKQNGRQIIAPTIKLMLALKNKLTLNNSELLQVEKELADLNEQLSVMTKLRAKNYIDNDSYIEQTNEMMKRINSLRVKRRLFINRTDGDENISGLRQLEAIIDGGCGEMVELDTEMFHKTVVKITAANADEIRFHLLGGLTLTEYIRRG